MKKPYKSYFGGKEATGVFQAIINQIPPHSLYCELFVGNGAIYRKKKKSRFSLLCDKDSKVVAEWVKFGEKEMDFYDWQVRSTPESCIINDNAIMVLNDSLLDDWRPTLDCEGTFIFLDPPYPLCVRKKKIETYDCELTNQDHEALLEVIRSYVDAKIMICSYPNEIYDTALSDWRYIDFQGQTRRGKIIERIYMNYPEPKELHDYSYVGKNYRDRWRIEKSKRNILVKLERLPALERNAILEAVTEALKSKIHE